MPLKVLIVPDKFKGTLTAQAAAKAIARGWRKGRPANQLELMPMCDGGDGFGEIVAGLIRAKTRTTRTVNAAHQRDLLIRHVEQHLSDKLSGVMDAANRLHIHNWLGTNHRWQRPAAAAHHEHQIERHIAVHFSNQWLDWRFVDIIAKHKPRAAVEPMADHMRGQFRWQRQFVHQHRQHNHQRSGILHPEGTISCLGKIMQMKLTTSKFGMNGRWLVSCTVGNGSS
jgi:hypothetical protein